MKDFLVNIFKTLFFFDLSLIVTALLPKIKSSQPSNFHLYNEGVAFLVILIFTFVFVRIVESRMVKVLYKGKKSRAIITGCVISFFIFVVTLGVMFIAKSFTLGKMTKAEKPIFWILAILFNVLTEEFLIHGYLFNLFKKYYGSLPTVIITALLYISLHIEMFKMGKLYWINTMLFSILLSLLLCYTENILAPIMLHFIFNLMSSFVLGFQTIFSDMPSLFTPTFSGKTLISGGASPFFGSAVFLVINLALNGYFIYVLFVKNKKKKKVRKYY